MNLMITTSTGIETLPENPDRFYLRQNFPNPVRNSTSLSFYIPGDGKVAIEIFNNGGQIVETLVNKQLGYGDHTVPWNSSNQPSGLYLCRMSYAGSSLTRKIMVFH